MEPWFGLSVSISRWGEKYNVALQHALDCAGKRRIEDDAGSVIYISLRETCYEYLAL